MRNCLALVKKELHSLFVSPIAYVILAVFFAVTGYFFYIILGNVIEFMMQRAFQSQQFGAAPPPFDASTTVIRGFFGVLGTILLFLVPMITMGVFAEEKRRGTLELLFTSPLTNLQLILGKFTALVLFLLVMLVPSILNSVLLYYLSDPTPPLSPMLMGYLGCFSVGRRAAGYGCFCFVLDGKPDHFSGDYIRRFSGAVGDRCSSRIGYYTGQRSYSLSVRAKPLRGLHQRSLRLAAHSVLSFLYFPGTFLNFSVSGFGEMEAIDARKSN